MSDPLREMSRYLNFGNRAISSGRRGIDNFGRAFQVDPRRRDADESGLIARDQRNWFRAEQTGYARGALDDYAAQRGLSPRTERGFSQGGRGGGYGGPGYGAPGYGGGYGGPGHGGGYGGGQPDLIVKPDGSAWQIQRPGWLGRQFGSQPEIVQVAPEGSYRAPESEGRTPYQPQPEGRAPYQPRRDPQSAGDLPPVAAPSRGGRGPAEQPQPPARPTRDQQVAFDAYMSLPREQRREVTQTLERSGLLPQGATASGVGAGQLSTALSTALNRNGYSTASGGMLERVQPRQAFEGVIAAESQRGAAPAAGAGRTPATPGAAAATPATPPALLWSVVSILPIFNVAPWRWTKVQLSAP
ncbi:MAG: hypothetical protein K2Q12_01440 [Rickettsiales bacterium]|nr:hypothetical protein [Rickettsiales bacterium]